MTLNIQGYKGNTRVVSIALKEEVRDDLLGDELDFLYITETEIILYPDGTVISNDRDIIERLGRLNSYDVFILRDDGRLIRYYDDSSIDNYFFITAKCNSNCVMCPSPDVSRKNGISADAGMLIEIARHIPTYVSHLTITGGEPFMIGEKIFPFLAFLRNKFSETEFLILTNGRIFAVDSFVQNLWENLPYNSIIGIPLHASCPEIHDAITQVPKSFAQTVSGIRHLLQRQIRIELRIVVSRLNIEDMNALAEFIVSEMPEVAYVSIMAMEMTGSAHKNRDLVWIPYKEAAMRISDAVMTLIRHGIDVRLYNFPLCAVSREYWTLCEKSISPQKIRYSEGCDMCRVRNACGGVFAGTLSMEKSELKAVL